RARSATHCGVTEACRGGHWVLSLSAPRSSFVGRITIAAPDRGSIASMGGQTAAMAEHRLGPSQHVAWIRENVVAVRSTPLDRLDSPVVDCPGWQIDSVADQFAALTAFYEACLSLPSNGSPAEVAGSLSWPEPPSGPAAVESCRRRYDNLLGVV